MAFTGSKGFSKNTIAVQVLRINGVVYFDALSLVYFK